MVERKKLTVQEILQLHKEMTQSPDVGFELLLLVGLVVAVLFLVIGFAASGPSFTPGPGQYGMR